MAETYTTAGTPASLTQTYERKPTPKKRQEAQLKALREMR